MYSGRAASSAEEVAVEDEAGSASPPSSAEKAAVAFEAGSASSVEEAVVILEVRAASSVA